MEPGVELDALIAKMIDSYVSRNRAATLLRDSLDEVGVGFYPVADHLTLRTLDIDRRAEEFTRLGYGYSETIEYEDWYAKVYRKVGYPALFVDQAYADERGRTSIIPGWVKKFGDTLFHHVAVRVEDIDKAIERLKARGVVFTGNGGRPAFFCIGTRRAPPRLSGIFPSTSRQLDEIHRRSLVPDLLLPTTQ
jgi:catechol 2,3-dioxygenase-like lactoylglutathione lyase family enzyme